jgi:hypothetical protein
MPADHALHIELERLADVANHEIEVCATGSAADAFSLAAREACAAITERLVRAGVDRRVAEWATTVWICGGRRYIGSVWECKEHADYYAELGLIQPAGS